MKMKLGYSRVWTTLLVYHVHVCVHIISTYLYVYMYKYINALVLFACGHHAWDMITMFVLQAVQ